jgi:hypothetical protein
LSKAIVPIDIGRAVRKHSEANARFSLAVELMQREPVLHKMLVECAISRKLTVEDILPASREKNIVNTMHEFFYRGMTETSASTVLLGHISARDHSTVMYGASRWATLKRLPIPRGYDGSKYLKADGKQRGATNVA